MKRTMPVGDTIPPFGIITIAFSASIASGALDPEIVPAFGIPYSTHLNGNRDTFFISLNGILPGQTRFVIRFIDTIKSIESAILAPGADSIVFVSGPICSGQNFSQKTADSLAYRVFGTVALAYDTLYFSLVEPVASWKIYLRSFNAPCGLFVRDRQGRTSFSSLDVVASETLSVVDSLARPLVAGIFSVGGNAHSNFECGIIP